jgi:thioredoxin-related protein
MLNVTLPSWYHVCTAKYKTMKMKKGLGLTILVVAVSVVVTVLAIANEQRSPTAQQQSIEWITIDQLAAKQAKEPRKVMVDLYTDWCGWCKKMDSGTFADANVSKYLGEKFYAVKFNAESPGKVTFKGKTYEFEAMGNRGANGLAVELGSFNGRLGYPTIVILDESLNKLETNPGYKDAASLLSLIKYYGDDHYKTLNFQQYQQIGK